MVTVITIDIVVMWFDKLVLLCLIWFCYGIISLVSRMDAKILLCLGFTVMGLGLEVYGWNLFLSIFLKVIVLAFLF